VKKYAKWFVLNIFTQVLIEGDPQGRALKSAPFCGLGADAVFLELSLTKVTAKCDKVL